MTFNPIDLLPQKAPMAFITAIESIDFDEQKMVARIDVKDTDLLFQKNINGISSAVALEYMAQSIACYIGAQDIHVTGETKAVAGFIMGSRDLHIMIPKFNVNESYYVHVQSLFCDNNIASFECEIYDCNDNIVAKGNLNAFRPDDINNFMENGHE